MKIFIKRLFRRIGYRLVRFLVPCIVIGTLISCMCLSASALTIDAKDAEFELEGFYYYDGDTGSSGSMMGNVYIDGVNSEASINNGGSFVLFPKLQSYDLQLTPSFKTLYNYGVNGVLTVSIKCYDGYFPYWALEGYCYLRGENGEKLVDFVEQSDGSITAIYNGPLPKHFSIITICDVTHQLSEVFYYNISFSAIHNGADTTNFDLYESVEQELLNSQKPALQEGIDFLTSVGGQPTTGMRNGLAVVSQFMTRFLNYNEFRAIYNISLSLGLFAFVVGMALLIGTIRKNKGGK